MSHFFFEKNSILCALFFLKVHFFGSYSKKKFNSLSLFFSKVQFFESYSTRRVNSWSHIQKEVLFFETYSERGSILWVILKKERFNSFGSCSLSQIQKRFTSWNQIKKEVRLFELNSKKVQFFEPYSIKKVQPFESNWEEVHKKRFNSMSHFKRVPSFETFFDTRFNSLSHFPWKEDVKFFESYFLKRRGSILESYQRKKVQFFGLH